MVVAGAGLIVVGVGGEIVADVCLFGSGGFGGCWWCVPLILLGLSCLLFFLGLRLFCLLL